MEINYSRANRLKLEAEIIGTILNSSNNQLTIKELMFNHGYDNPTVFCSDFHNDVYSIILKCWENGIAADIISVSRLKQPKYKYVNSKVNFDHKIVEYTCLVATSAHLEYHLFILKQYIYCDFWNDVAEDIISKQWDERDVVDFSINVIDSFKSLETRMINKLRVDNQTKNTSQIIKERWELVNSGKLFTIPFGTPAIDEFMGGGFYPAEFFLIAGRPGMGKTSIALAIALVSSRYDRVILFFSLEMDKTKLLGRLAASSLNIDYKDIRSGKITVEQLYQVTDWIDEFEKNNNLIFVDDCRTLDSIKAKIEEVNPDGIIIDYLQLILLTSSDYKTKVGNREQEVSTISRELKNITLDKKIPVIALSQLSRKVEERSSKVPMLSDLRESGSLEQDADGVIFVYRDSYYRVQRKEYVPEDELGNTDIIFAKGREIGVKVFQTHFDAKKHLLVDDYAYTPVANIPEPKSIIPPPPK